mgnify:CR=1 FL=1
MPASYRGGSEGTHAPFAGAKSGVPCHGWTAPKELKEDNDVSDNSGDEQMRLDPFSVFERYFREKDSKGTGKGMGSHG